jgi:RNA processing factor Prp31
MSILDNLYCALTKKAQTANKDITKEMVEDWVEDASRVDNQIAFMSMALRELYSGEYTAGEMVEDILQLTYLDN